MTDTIVIGERKVPVHLWVVGILSLLWNAFGAFDYFMTRTKGAEWIGQMMDGVDASAYMDYINGFPLWASFGWGLGVWGAVAGSVLLLMRHRWAVPVFAASLVGAVLGIGYQLMTPPNVPAFSEGANKFVPYVVVAIALALFLYARAQRANGVLR